MNIRFFVVSTSLFAGAIEVVILCSYLWGGLRDDVYWGVTAGLLFFCCDMIGLGFLYFFLARDAQAGRFSVGRGSVVLVATCTKLMSLGALLGLIGFAKLPAGAVAFGAGLALVALIAGGFWQHFAVMRNCLALRKR